MKGFIKPFAAPKISVKIKILLFSLRLRMGREGLTPKFQFG